MGIFKWLSRILQWFKTLFRCKKPVPPVSAEWEMPSNETDSSFLVYTVYIPTLDGRFDYLGTGDYSPDDIVVIPFGAENRKICGIVEKRQRYPVDKLPLPLWKMKYILGKAPEPVVKEYLRQKSR